MPRLPRAARRCLMGAATLTAVLVATPPAAAQIPTEYTNLQVLPEDITRAQIVPLMRNYATALGVRCNYCHTVSEALNQPDDDFASDAKSTKRKARLMMQMVQRINDETLAMLPSRGTPEVNVTCETCHGGVTRPVPIARIVLQDIQDGDVEEAMAHYRDLREQYHGTRAYDFGFIPLNNVGARLTAAERFADAVAVLEVNAEFNPLSLPTLLQLGQAHERNDDNESALEVYRGMLELDAGLPFADFYLGQARERITAIGG